MQKRLKHQMIDGIYENYQPLSVALKSFYIKQLDGYCLRFEPLPQLVIDVAFMDGAKPTLSEQVVDGEVLGDGPELA